MTITERVACPRNCGTTFLRQPIACAVLHSCPHSSYGRRYKNVNQRDEIEIIVGGPHAGEQLAAADLVSSKRR